MRDKLRRLERIEKKLNMDKKKNFIIVFPPDFPEEKEELVSELIMNDKDLNSSVDDLILVVLFWKNKKEISYSIGGKEKVIRVDI